MRVLMTTDAVGGVWTYALELAAALAPHGVETHLAVMGPCTTDRLQEASAAAGVASVRHGDFALEWMPDPWADVDRAGSWLLDLADRLRPDVVHLNGYAHAALRWPAPAVVVAHSCVLSWWSAVQGTEAPPCYDTYRGRVAAGLAAADAVVAPTHAMLAELLRYGVDRGTVVPNCRRQDWVRPTVKEPLVMGAGRVWDEAKNLRRLAAVAPRLPWRVAIAGDATAPAAGAALPAGSKADPAGRPEGGEGADLLGPLPWGELAGWLLRAAVYAAPASYEPFGLGPLEAAQAGCALVLGDIPSLREVWGDAALYVAPRDDDALAATLARVAGDPTLRARLAGRAHGRAAAYTPARTAAGYLAVYDRVRSAARCAS